jgi:dolichol-phosphate mannosyltransferase
MDFPLIIIPTYNEKENLEALVEAIWQLEQGFKILVVDDNSPDGTGILADELAGRYPDRMFVQHRAGKLGLASAYLEGFRFGLAQGARYLIEMDADFSHHPSYLPQLLEAAQEADLVLGSRYIAGGGTRNWGWSRKLISAGGNWYARLLLGLPFADLTGGFKCFRREVLESIDLTSIRSVGYAFQVELTYRASQKGFRIREIPIVFEDRQKGRSKMSRKIFLEAALILLKIRFESKSD